MNAINALFLKLMMTGSKWELDTFLKNLNNSLGKWGQAIVAIIGLVLIIIGVFKIAQGLMSGGRGQTNWVLSIGMILIGGILALSTSFQLLKDIGKGANDTLNNMGNTGDGGMILPLLRAMLPF